MSTVAKAIELLNLFSAERAEIRLAEFQRLTGRDKTTTYRHLSALESTGLLEKDKTTRAYRMGPAVLRLSHIREATVPRRAGLRRILPALADSTGETAHASLLQGSTLVTLAVHASAQHTARVVLEETDLPLHATASGIAVLAFAAEPLKDAAYNKLEKFTEHTVTDVDELDQILNNVRKTGFGESVHGFENGVAGIAVPLFDSSNEVAGSIAVASVDSRLNDELVMTIKRELVKAAQSVSESWGGAIPLKLKKIWAPYN